MHTHRHAVLMNLCHLQFDVSHEEGSNDNDYRFDCLVCCIKS